MKNRTAVDLTKLVKDFILLEHKITEAKGENGILELRLDETNRLLKIAQNKENQLTEVENERLKTEAVQMKKENEGQLEQSKIHLQALAAEKRALHDQHQREMEDHAEETHRKLNAKDSELKTTCERYECALEEMRNQMREKEKEKQSQLLKLQMEFGAKLARAQSMSMKSQTQAQASSPRPQNIFKRKLQFIQEEKNKEIEALRQRVWELEQHSLHSTVESRLKRRKH
ncbi:hypothetical protein DNTS_034116 [Danionella cerebrum]|uniref:Coiled-coil domain-containing protein 152 n=1 Tax=Danionella cerebrum TaxID=2873325 RepID=A0A553R6Q6_9TELE|nr:hypothetical protein DNTS_034116 [Danionella translucida]TRY97872.1 hypothetical protein DNTS_034116 [Danionella translucida]